MLSISLMDAGAQRCKGGTVSGLTIV